MLRVMAYKREIGYEFVEGKSSCCIFSLPLLSLFCPLFCLLFIPSSCSLSLFLASLRSLCFLTLSFSVLVFPQLSLSISVYSLLCPILLSLSLSVWLLSYLHRSPPLFASLFSLSSFLLFPISLPLHSCPSVLSLCLPLSLRLVVPPSLFLCRQVSLQLHSTQQRAHLTSLSWLCAFSLFVFLSSLVQQSRI